jgi:hypothetical protein
VLGLAGLLGGEGKARWGRGLRPRLGSGEGKEGGLKLARGASPLLRVGGTGNARLGIIEGEVGGEGKEKAKALPPPESAGGGGVLPCAAPLAAPLALGLKDGVGKGGKAPL